MSRLKFFPRVILGVAAMAMFVTLPSPTFAAPVVFSAAGANPASIQATVDSFRNALGPLNPNVAGSFGTGRREINWDGVPDGFSAPNNFPRTSLTSTHLVAPFSQHREARSRSAPTPGSRPLGLTTSIRLTPALFRPLVPRDSSPPWAATSWM